MFMASSTSAFSSRDWTLDLGLSKDQRYTSRQTGITYISDVYY